MFFLKAIQRYRKLPKQQIFAANEEMFLHWPQASEREILYSYHSINMFWIPPSKGEPMTHGENLTSGKRTFKNNLKSNVFSKLP